METFTFMSNRGDRVTVTAINEWRARSAAMEVLWGSIRFQPEWLGKDWVGKGLMLEGNK